MSGPIIILGAARSGTKLLRDLIAADPSCRAVPYDVNFIWCHGNRGHPDDRLPASKATDPVRRYIVRQLYREAGADPKRGDILVEKSVSNTLRVPFVQAVFPEAKFVHLIRDGRDVAVSARRHWLAPPDYGYLLQKLKRLPWRDFDYLLWFAANGARGLLHGRKGGGVWGPRYPGIGADIDRLSVLELCARQWQACVTQARADLAAVPAAAQYELCYENLIAHPEAELGQLASFLGLDQDAVTRAGRTQVSSASPGGWRQHLSAEEAEFLQAQLGPSLAEFGYPDARA